MTWEYQEHQHKQVDRGYAPVMLYAWEGDHERLGGWAVQTGPLQWLVGLALKANPAIMPTPDRLEAECVDHYGGTPNFYVGADAESCFIDLTIRGTEHDAAMVLTDIMRWSEQCGYDQPTEVADFLTLYIQTEEDRFWAEAERGE